LQICLYRALRTLLEGKFLHSSDRGETKTYRQCGKGPGVFVANVS
jgi:hypothetical protein